MKWSQLKKRIEATFAESVRGRVEVWNTRYRKSHDSEGEAWITIDGKMVFNFATYTYFVEYEREVDRLREERGCTDWRDPSQFDGYHQAGREADELVHGRGIFPLWRLNAALFDYLNLSIDEIAKSENPIIRAFGMLDRRFGKRHLKEYDAPKEHPLVRTLHRLRCEAEGIELEPRQTHAGDG
jgi:hypothetical protein